MSLHKITIGLVATAMLAAGVNASCDADSETSTWPAEAAPLAAAGGCAMVSTALGMGLTCEMDLADSATIQGMAPGITGTLCGFCCKTCADNGADCSAVASGGAGAEEDHTDSCDLEAISAVYACAGTEDVEACSTEAASKLSTDCQACIAASGNDGTAQCAPKASCSKEDLDKLMKCQDPSKSDEENMKCSQEAAKHISGECTVCFMQNPDNASNCMAPDDCDMTSDCADACADAPTDCDSFTTMASPGGCASSCAYCVKKYYADMVGGCEVPLPEGCAAELMEGGCDKAAPCFDPAQCAGNTEGPCAECATAAPCSVCYPQEKDTSPHAGEDNDACLQAHESWGEGYKCSENESYCPANEDSSYQEMGECCQHTCKTLIKKAMPAAQAAYCTTMQCCDDDEGLSGHSNWGSSYKCAEETSYCTSDSYPEMRDFCCWSCLDKEKQESLAQAIIGGGDDHDDDHADDHADDNTDDNAGDNADDHDDDHADDDDHEGHDHGEEDDHEGHDHGEEDAAEETAPTDPVETVDPVVDSAASFGTAFAAIVGMASALLF